MGDVDTPNCRQGTDAICWKEAVQLYNSKLKNGTSNKKYINLTVIDKIEQGSKDYAHELMETAMDSYQRLNKKRSPLAKMLIGIYNHLRQYASAIDVFIQSDPRIASLVWGSIRVLLKMGDEEERASRTAAEGIIEIVRQAGRWEQVSAVSNLLDSARIRKALVALYVRVLEFLMSSTQWLRRRSLERLGVSLLMSKGDKFQEMLNGLRNAAGLVDKELQTQATYKGLDSLGEITSNIHTVMDKIDGISEQVQHLSDHTPQLQLHDRQLALTHETTISVDAVLCELKSLVSIPGAILNKMQGASDLNRMKQWLSNAVETPLPVPHTDGTCNWILQHTSFLKWTHSEETPVLWIEGHLGCGKSVLAGYLHEHLAAQGSNTLFHRFQLSASATHSTPTSFASSLIYQLLEKSTALTPVGCPYRQLQNLATQFPLGPQNCPFKKVWAVATSLLEMCRGKFNLVIDAMDECSFDNTSTLTASVFLNTLFESIRETGSKVAIFARPEPIFVPTVKSSLSIFMAKDLVLPDIMTFAEKVYEQLGLPPAETDEVLEIVRSSSHGSFRWTELFLHHLGQSLQTADFRTRMRTLPPSISDLYRGSLLSAAQKFSRGELECQKALFLAIFQAQRPMKTVEIAEAFSLRPEKAEIIISDLCKPLASTYGGFFHLSHPSVREFFELYHRADDSSLGISFSESHGLLAEKCLSCLLNERYADLNSIGSYLKMNNDETARVNVDPRAYESGFYDYASRFWDYHLVRAKRPSKSLLRQANDFILSLQFAYWAERSRRECGQLVRVNLAFGSLVSWHSSLSREDQALVEMDKYFERAYSQLSDAFSSRTTDRVLKWLAQMTVGEFYFIVVFPDKATSVREQALAGLQDLLGPRHHLTLHAKSDVAYVRLYAGKMLESNEIYNEVTEIQREVLGEHSSQYLETLIYKGQSEYYMADFAAATMTWTKTAADFLTLLGPDSWQYLTVQLWYARGIAYMGQQEIALRILQSVVQKRRELFGPSDSFANAVEINVGEIQLLLGRYEESVATLQDVLVWRRKAFSLSNIFRLDAEITLAAAYQMAGMRGAALAIIEEIEDGVINLRSLFERYCQVAHLKGLLLVEGGFLNEAIHLLQKTVIQTEENENNRALLWIRLDLSTLLRKRDAEGDRGEASAVFNHIVKDGSRDNELEFSDEPDPPRLLAAAEKALRLVRSRKHVEARQELDSQRLAWRRPSDFWLWVGGSFCKDILHITDTTTDTTLARIC